MILNNGRGENRVNKVKSKRPVCVARPLLMLGVLSFIVRRCCLFGLFAVFLKLDLLATCVSGFDISVDITFWHVWLVWELELS